MRRKVTRAWLIVLLAFGASGGSAGAATALPSNTLFYGNLNQTLDTGKAHAGDGFTLYVIAPYPNNDAETFSGARIKGVVESVTRAGQGRKPSLQLTFRRIVLNDGRSYPMSGAVASEQTKQGSNAVSQAAGALGGMLVGNAIGKTIFHSSAGGPLGALGGFVYGNNNKANFSVPQGSAMSVVLTQPLNI